METADPVSPAQRRLTLAATTLGRSLLFLEVTIVSVALPSIQRDLGVSTSFLVWIVNGYLLAMCVLLVAAGRLGDLVGHRRIFELGLAVFTLASAACALAPSASLLLAARAAQGVGAALLFPPAQSLVTDVYPPEERGRALSILISGSAVTFAIGPFAGGLLAEHVGWRSIFWISVPLALAALAMTRAYVPEARGPALPRRVGLPSVALFGVGLAAVVFGLMQVGPWGLGSPGVLAALVVGAAALALFGVLEPGRSAPLVDFDLFRNRVFSGATTAMFTYQWVFLAFTVFTLVYLQIGLGYSPSGAGVVFLPVALAIIPALLVAGRIVDRFGTGPPLLGGLAMLALALLWVSSIAADASGAELAGPFVLFGVAIGLTIVPIQTSGMNAVAPTDRGLAAGILGAVRQVGGVLGIALIGLLLTTMERNSIDRVLGGLPPTKRMAERGELDGLLAGNSEAHKALARFDSHTALQLRTDVADAVDDAFARGLLVTAVLVVVCTALVAFLVRQTRVPSPSAAPSE